MATPDVNLNSCGSQSAISESGGKRVTVDGKFLRLGGAKFFLKGVTYGPFSPNDRGEHFCSEERTRADFAMVRDLGANVVRVYYVPPRWLLDLALEAGLRVMVDVPWPKHLCFMDSARLRSEARRTVREAVRSAKGHAAVLAFSVANEIPAEIVRWSGARRTARFVDELIEEAKAEDGEALCTFTSYPPTEYLSSELADFNTFNVYLHERPSFEAYLARLQVLAGERPLVLGEFGMDSIREGERAKSEYLAWQIQAASRGGLAGVVVFSFTDDWYRGGMMIEDWAFGLTTAARDPKPSFGAVRNQFRRAPYYPLARTPKVSVVVASYNGGRTLRACLASLGRLNYPDYEVILVDDGSTDDSAAIAADFPSVRCVRQENLGLSAARNAGIAAAGGEVVAFTDSDCRADEDWLYYLMGDMTRENWVGVGGPNFLPPEDSPVAAAVMASPGGPAHVLLTDREAEHVPGCNMAYLRSALEGLEGFDPLFRKAGDDVDVCWRMRESGCVIGFSPSAFVWHYRRSTVRAYLRQQAGYGEAEAMLARKHPEYFNFSGGGIWRGRIYGLGNPGILLRAPIIYHGVFGSGFFQRMYSPDPSLPMMLCTTLGFHGWVNVPLVVLTLYVSWMWPLTAVCLGLSFGTCVVAAAQAPLERSKRRLWSRPLIACLFFLQPIVRGWARLAVRLNLRNMSLGREGRKGREEARVAVGREPEAEHAYWSRGGGDRIVLLDQLTAALRGRSWQLRLDSGWGDYDFEAVSGSWTRLRVASVTEELEQGRRVVRFRVDRWWSARAWLMFGAASGMVMLAVAQWAAMFPMMWVLIVIPALLLWCLDDDGLAAQEELEAAMDGTADAAGWVRLEREANAECRMPNAEL